MTKLERPPKVKQEMINLMDSSMFTLTFCLFPKPNSLCKLPVVRRKLRKPKNCASKKKTIHDSYDEATAITKTEAISKVKSGQNCLVTNDKSPYQPYGTCVDQNLSHQHRNSLSQPMQKIVATVSSSQDLRSGHIRIKARLDQIYPKYSPYPSLDTGKRPPRCSSTSPTATKIKNSSTSKDFPLAQTSPTTGKNFAPDCLQKIPKWRPSIPERSSSRAFQSSSRRHSILSRASCSQKTSTSEILTEDSGNLIRRPSSKPSISASPITLHHRVSLASGKNTRAESSDTATCYIFDFPKPPSQNLSSISNGLVSKLPPKKSLYFQALVRRNEENFDPLWTILLQGAMREKCVRELCVVIGRMYFIGNPTADRILKGDMRQWNVQKAVVVLKEYLVIGGQALNDLVRFLRTRLKIDSVLGGWMPVAGPPQGAARPNHG
ncbi:putative powdery mildew-specific protein [Blumeria hordei DH14]|uniref:Putative powdery mildew-specific protein n=1 Tax=Blumeria graminis f. sp. hordei (strain DH14) TaxID=546991 RepID=N1JGW9_BLUG1|nr:putative powdery mildew-specific protein [Blumeria hordei DH14]